VDTQSFSEAEEVYGEIEEDQADTEIFLEPSPDDTPPLVAELHEEVVVDGAVLEEHGEDDPKQRHRLRLFQAMAFFFVRLWQLPSLQLVFLGFSNQIKLVHRRQRRKFPVG
jgi:hypothetical protein